MKLSQSPRKCQSQRWRCYLRPMDGSPAQLVALGCYCNACVRGWPEGLFFPSNSTTQFCEYVRFVRPHLGLAAATPDDWLARSAAGAPGPMRSSRRSQELSPEILAFCGDPQAGSFCGAVSAGGAAPAFGRSLHWRLPQGSGARRTAEPRGETRAGGQPSGKVFRGMGSWDDLSFEGAEQTLYEWLTDALLMQIVCEIAAGRKLDGIRLESVSIPTPAAACGEPSFHPHTGLLDTSSASPRDRPAYRKAARWDRPCSARI